MKFTSANNVPNQRTVNQQTTNLLTKAQHCQKETVPQQYLNSRYFRDSAST
jgi:hypothetical protein